MALSVSVLDLVPLVQGGTSPAALRNAGELARALDRLGYTRLWYAEHHNMPGIVATTPEILIAHVGPMTTRIRLGAGGVMLPNHSPLKVAESYKLLEAMHPGRIDLGIGRAPGTDGLTALALRRSRAALAADDFLEQLERAHRMGQRDVSGRASVPRRPRDARRPAAAPHLHPRIERLRREGGRARWASGLRLRDISVRIRPSLRCAPTARSFRRAACSTNPTPSSRFRSSAPTPRRRPGAWPRRCCSRSSSFGPGVRAGCRAPTRRWRTSSRRKSGAIAAVYKKLQIVGTPEQVRARIEDVVARTEADEVMIATHAYDPAARIRSYELVAQAFGLPGSTAAPSAVQQEDREPRSGRRSDCSFDTLGACSGSAPL